MQLILVTKYVGDWISFWGSIIGSIFGGGVTLAALWLTLKYYRKKDREDSREADEKKRLSLIPYLNCIAYSYKGYEERYSISFPNLDNGMMNLFSCHVHMKNVGLGTAVNIKFHSLSPCPRPNVEGPSLTLAVGEHAIIELNADLRTDSGIGNKIFLDINFSDLLGNKYKQTLSLTINFQNKYFQAGSVFHPELIL